jgi:hypothetical protein
VRNGEELTGGERSTARYGGSGAQQRGRFGGPWQWRRTTWCSARGGRGDGEAVTSKASCSGDGRRLEVRARRWSAGHDKHEGNWEAAFLPRGLG